KDTVEYGFEHREEARNLGGKEEWTEKILKPGWTLYDYAIFVDSERGHGTSASVKVQDDVIIIDGKTGYGAATLEGGNYKAVVKATYLKLYKVEGTVAKEKLPKMLTIQGLRKERGDFDAMTADISKNLSSEPNVRVVEAKKVALDANDGNGHPYLNSNLS